MEMHLFVNSMGHICEPAYKCNIVLSALGERVMGAF